MGSGNFRGSSPTPVIPGYYAADGNTFVAASVSSPIPTSPGARAAATTDTCTNGTLGAAGSFTWAADTNRRSLLLVNTGSNSLWYNVGASASNANFELKPGAGVRWDDSDGSAQKQRTIFSTSGTTYSYEEVIA